MDWKDLLLTPLYLPFIYLAAYFYRQSQSDRITRKYFMPALGIKLFGAVALGLIYQFYYRGGDTFNYFLDTRFVWEAFLKNPFTALRILLADGNYHSDLYEYTRRMYFYPDTQSFHVVRVAGFFSLFTFNTYTLIGMYFALLCFTGLWAMYKAWYDMYPHLHRPLAWAIFFIPSVFFWGSGLLKDTLTLGALGWAFHAFYFGFIRRRKLALNLVVFLISTLIIQSIKVYILHCFLPAAFLWLFLQYRAGIRSAAMRALALPVVLALALPLSYLAVSKISEDSSRYSLDKIAYTTQETSKWLLYVSQTQGGSAYSLGELDGTLTGMLTKFPQAVFVTLYRPFLWEARNPVMLLSALEALLFLFLTLRIFWEVKLGRLFILLQRQPVLLFSLLFALVFSFAVGIASYNFGTLVRYKIPMMPFFLAALLVIRHEARTQQKSPKKVARFA